MIGIYALLCVGIYLYNIQKLCNTCANENIVICVIISFTVIVISGMWFTYLVEKNYTKKGE